MPYIVCGECQMFFHPKTNGVEVEEMKPAEYKGPGEWTGYKVWKADLLECRGCGAQIAAGFGLDPISLDYQPGYATMAERALWHVKDCP